MLRTIVMTMYIIVVAGAEVMHIGSIRNLIVSLLGKNISLRKETSYKG